MRITIRPREAETAHSEHSRTTKGPYPERETVTSCFNSQCFCQTSFPWSGDTFSNNKRPDLCAVTTDSFSCCFPLLAQRRIISFQPGSTSTTAELLQKHTHIYPGFYLFRGIVNASMKQRTTPCDCRNSHGCWLRYETWQWRGPRRKYWSWTAALAADYSQQVIRWKVLMNFSACSALADWQRDSSQDQINFVIP